MNFLDELIYNKLKLVKEAVMYQKDCPNWDANTANFPTETRKSLKIISPDAVYHFNKQPFILFFDFSGSVGDEREIILHKQIWCFDKAPIAFFIFEDEVKIYNAFCYQREVDRLAELEIPNYEELFSFWNLQSGGTWRWIQENFYVGGRQREDIIRKNRVNQKLFDNIKEARKRLTGEVDNPLNGKFVNILILRLIFIRYLIDRGVEIDKRYIQGRALDEKKQSLNALIANKEKLQAFFEYLEERFNGNLFETKKDPRLEPCHLSELSAIFSAHKNQYFLFDVFDFSIIPVEVISGIYESVIDPLKREYDSAIYTPAFLVDYILSQTVEMALEKDRKECKVLDPACGSGIFLVQSYRKLVEKNRDKNGLISDTKLVDLMRNNVFGIDKDFNALRVAAFSLYVALLDYKYPPEIKKFELPRLLDQNLFEADVFNEEASFNHTGIFREKGFDFILGNPPWGKKPYALHLNYATKNSIPIANHQIAQTFLARTKDFANNHTVCALIVTSKAFYNLWSSKEANLCLTEYSLDNLKNEDISEEVIDQLSSLRNQDFSNKSKFIRALVSTIGEELTNHYESLLLKHATKGFRAYFFNKFYVDSLLDLSAVRRDPFEDSNNPAVIVFYRYAFGQNTAENIVKHFSVKPNLYLQYFKVLVIEKQGQKSILQKYFIEYDWMLKVALYGNTLDHHFLKILVSQNSTIQSFLNGSNDIYAGDGIKKLTNTAIQKLNPQQKKQISPFSEIANIPILETQEISEYYSVVNKENLPQDVDLLVKSGRHEELYRGKHILLKARPKDETRIVASYVDTACVYREKVLGISTAEKINELKELYGIFNSRLYTYYQFMTSCSWGIFYPEIMQQEYTAFPYAEIENRKHFIATVTRIIDHYKSHLSSGARYEEIPLPETDIEQINDMVNEAYSVNTIQSDLVDYVWQIARYEFQVSRISDLIRPPSNDELHEYAEIFYNHFSPIYDEDDEYFQIDIYKMSYFVAMKFSIIADHPRSEAIKFGEYTNEENFFQNIAQSVSLYELSNRIFLQKDVKGFEEDFFYLIKPNEYKSWHRAIAHYDLAEFMDAIIKAEMKQAIDQ